jgi:hypothetical protein
MTDEAIVYTIPGSHAARTGELMVAPRGLRPLTAGFAGYPPDTPYRRVDLTPGLHRVYVRLKGFHGDRDGWLWTRARVIPTSWPTTPTAGASARC